MPRYLVSCLGLVILSAAYGIYTLKKKVLFTGALALYTVISLPILYNVYTKYYNGPARTAYEDLKDKVKPGDIFIHGSEHNLGTFSIYFPDNYHYLYIPEDFIPFSGYEIFKDKGSYGHDYLQFNKQDTTLWLTFRQWEYYNMPSAPILNDSNRQINGPLIKYSLPDSWYSISVIRADYVPDGVKDTVSEEKTGIGTLEVNITDMKSDEGVLVYALYDSGPIDASHSILNGGVPITDGKADIKFDNLNYGEYLLFCFHDENQNQQPDFKEGNFSEGHVWTGDFTVDSFPDFEINKFRFNKDTSCLTLKMAYPE